MKKQASRGRGSEEEEKKERKGGGGGGGGGNKGERVEEGWVQGKRSRKGERE